MDILMLCPVNCLDSKNSYVDKNCNCMCQRTTEPLDPHKAEWNVKECNPTSTSSGEFIYNIKLMSDSDIFCYVLNYMRHFISGCYRIDQNLIDDSCETNEVHHFLKYHCRSADIPALDGSPGSEAYIAKLHISSAIW